MALTKASLVDLNSAELILDLNADTSIRANTDDTVDFKIAGNVEVKMTAAGLTPGASDGNALGTAALEWSDLFLADGAVINFGDDQDVSLTHVADTGILLSSTDKLMFNDASQFIQGASATVLDIAATDEIELTSTLVDVVGNLAVSGTIIGAGALTAATSITVGSAVLTEAELETLDGITVGTAIASKVVTTDANIDTSGQRNLTITGELDAATGDFSGDVDIDGTANLDVVDIDGATQIDATVTVGVNGTGYDVKFFGDTSGAHMLWDASVDDLILAGAGRLVVPEGNLVLGSAAITSTAGEINLIDGVATVGTTAVADGDGLLHNDNGIMKVTSAATFKTYFQEGISTAYDDLTTGDAAVLITTSSGNITIDAAADDSDIILKGTDGGADTTFLTIDGSAAGEATFNAGVIAPALTIDDVAVDGKVITMTGSSGDTFVTTVAANGATSLVTTDAAAAAAHLTITADGTVDINSAGVLTLDSGAAINIEPASGSAILLDGTISIDAGVVTGATSITSTAFVGGLTGNVTGNASGTALTVTQAAQSAITSVGTLTALTVDDVVIDGKVMTMTGSSGDTFVTTVAANGATSLVTTDASAAAANLAITADGTVDINSTGDLTLNSSTDIILDAGTQAIILKDDGTQFGKIDNNSSNIRIYSGTTLNTSMTGANTAIAGDLDVGDDLSLASDDAKLNFGANGDVSLIHYHDVGLILKNNITSDNHPVHLILQTGEVTIASDETIGTIQFQAPDEDSAVDSRLVCAAIDAVSEAAFSGGVNQTKLVFRTAESEVATTKLTITGNGTANFVNNVNLGGTNASGSVGPKGLSVFMTSNTYWATELVNNQSGNHGRVLLLNLPGDQDNGSSVFILGSGGASGSEVTRFVIYSDGDVYNHDNTYGSTSDERIKQNIADASSQWDDIKALRVRNFKKKDDVRKYGSDAQTQIGLIAQEAETVSPGLVKLKDPSKNDVASDSAFGRLYTSDDSETQGDDATEQVGGVKVAAQVKQMKYSVLYMKAIKALQEAMTRIETLETKVQALEDA